MKDWVNVVHLGSCKHMSAIPNDSVNCVVTSPPYFGLRSYGLTEGQFGNEPSADEYISNMVSVFREVRRTLRDDGTVWLNLGDMYASKNLLGIPWRVAFALQADGWFLRDAVIWAKPNPMPSNVTDRGTSSYEMVFMFAKSASYYADMECVKEPSIYSGETRKTNKNNFSAKSALSNGKKPSGNGVVGSIVVIKETRNLRNVWTIATKAYFGGDHPAVMPQELATRCILIGCPPGGIVLDPFMGSGTVADCAIGNGRRFVGYEINESYHTEISNRLGLFGYSA